MDALVEKVKYLNEEWAKKIFHYFGIKDVNAIYLNNLEIEEKFEYENNGNVEVLCKKELE